MWRNHRCDRNSFKFTPLLLLCENGFIWSCRAFTWYVRSWGHCSFSLPQPFREKRWMLGGSASPLSSQGWSALWSAASGWTRLKPTSKANVDRGKKQCAPLSDDTISLLTCSWPFTSSSHHTDLSFWCVGSVCVYPAATRCSNSDPSASCALWLCSNSSVHPVEPGPHSTPSVLFTRLLSCQSGNAVVFVAYTQRHIHTFKSHIVLQVFLNAGYYRFKGRKEKGATYNK